jgi:glutamate synthase (ferredoxin)
LQVNERAKVSVKLVAQAGIGTVASGVAKANADIIQVRLCAGVCMEGAMGGLLRPFCYTEHAGQPMCQHWLPAVQ